MFASYEVATSFPSLTAIKGYDLDKSTYVPLMGHIVGGWFWWFLVGGVHNGQSSKYSVLILFLGAPTCRADRTPTHGALDLALTDTFQIFIFSLNRAKKWFNSIFHSKLNPKYSFKKIIHFFLKYRIFIQRKYSFFKMRPYGPGLQLLPALTAVMSCRQHWQLLQAVASFDSS